MREGFSLSGVPQRRKKCARIPKQSLRVIVLEN
jgi:hypothetical protein